MSFAERNRLNQAVQDIADLKARMDDMRDRFVERLDALEAAQRTPAPAASMLDHSIGAVPPQQNVDEFIAYRMSKARAAKAAKRGGAA